MTLVFALTLALAFPRQEFSRTIVDPFYGRQINVYVDRIVVDGQSTKYPKPSAFSELDRYVWISEHEILLQLELRFMRFDLLRGFCRMAGNGYLSFHKNGVTGWIEPSGRWIEWRGHVVRLKRVGERAVAVGSRGDFMLGYDGVAYVVYAFLANGQLRELARLENIWGDELAAGLEPIGGSRFLFTWAEGRGLRFWRLATVSRGRIVLGDVVGRQTQLNWTPTRVNNLVRFEYTSEGDSHRVGVKRIPYSSRGAR